MAIDLHPGQQVAWEAENRFTAILAGTGGGKSFFGPIWLYREIEKYPGDIWMVISPTFKILNRATLPMLFQLFRGTPLEGVYKQQRSEYHLPGGGIIYCCSADKPNALEGGQIRGAWLDEPGQMKRWAWVVVQARLGQKQGRALLTTTPYFVNWLSRDFDKRATIVRVKEQPDGSYVVERTKGFDPDYLTIHFPSIVNPYYPREEYARMKEVLPSKEFSMRYGGEFEALSGLVFANFDDCVVEIDEYVPQHTDLRIGGLDPGWSEEFAGITAVYGKDGKVHLRHEIYELRMLLRDIAASLDRQTIYYIDPHATRESEELQQYGIDIQGGFTSIRPGVMKVNEFIKDKRLVVPESDFPNLLDEASTCSFAENKDEPDDKQPHHLLDALRYMIMGLVDSSRMEIYFV